MLGGRIDLGRREPVDLPGLRVRPSRSLVCVLVWLAARPRTRVGMIVRAATEDAERTRALGINVGRWVTPVFGFGIALAGLAGVLAAPFRAITADMGSNFIIILFAVVVIGGLGSILGRGRRRLPRRPRRGLRAGLRARAARRCSSSS